MSADRTRFEAAADAHAPALLRYFVRRVGQPEDAADALSEVFLTAWRRRADLPADPDGARMWLLGIARNVDLNRRRTLRRRLALVERLRKELAGSAAKVPEPAHERVNDALTALPPTQAEIVRLVHWDGFRLVEAAALLGISDSTARSRYAAARAALREHLAGVRC